MLFLCTCEGVVGNATRHYAIPLCLRPARDEVSITVCPFIGWAAMLDCFIFLRLGDLIADMVLDHQCIQGVNFWVEAVKDQTYILTLRVSGTAQNAERRRYSRKI